MIPLLISLLMLALAPIIYRIATLFQVFWSYAHKFFVTTVTTLVVLHLLPESIRIIGFPATVWSFLGLFLPSILERSWKSKAQAVHIISVIIAFLGLVAHGMMDGAALASPRFGNPSTHLLQWAVMLHRLPAALLIWSLFYHKKGPWFSTCLLVILGLATIFGFYLGQRVLEQLADIKMFYHFQALVSGSLLHIAFDNHGPHHHH